MSETWSEGAIYLKHTLRAIRRIREAGWKNGTASAEFTAGAKMAEDIIQGVIDYETQRMARKIGPPSSPPPPRGPTEGRAPMTGHNLYVQYTSDGN